MFFFAYFQSFGFESFVVTAIAREPAINLLLVAHLNMLIFYFGRKSSKRGARTARKSAPTLSSSITAVFHRFCFSALLNTVFFGFLVR